MLCADIFIDFVSELAVLAGVLFGHAAAATPDFQAGCV
jgi:hypothetical protein